MSGRLKLIRGGRDDQPAQAPATGNGWLRAAAIVEVLIATLWILGLLREIDRGLEESSARVYAAIAGWALAALAMVVDAVFLWLWPPRRWAWRLGVALAIGCLGFGFAIPTPAAIMVGAILVALLLAGADGVRHRESV